MKYEDYTVLDFVGDEQFQNWVKYPDEKSDFYWESWIQNHKEEKYLVLEAKEILLSINFPAELASPVMMDNIFEKILRKERPVSLEKIEALEMRSNSKIKRIIGIAAALLLLATFSFIFYDLYQHPKDSKGDIVFQEVIKENPPGRKSTFHLSDGSIIRLNASSKLRVIDGFGMETREVYLEGEAFFDISKNVQKPFIVHTGNISTLVTGTAFNVNAFKDNDNIEVAVLEGTVNTILYYEGGSDTLILEKSDMSIYNKIASKMSKTSYNYLETMGWKDGVIYFKNVNSNESFEYLERWFGVDIQVINQENISGAFYGEFKNEILENVLSAMSKALQFDYQIKDKIVVIKPKMKGYE